MKLILAFFKLIRWPNLFFIALTQLLFYFCVYRSLFSDPANHPWNYSLFYLLIAASVFIAAAGYIINDYFDLQIDTINKPEKVVVDKIVKRRWAIVWHWVLSGLGILLSAYISFRIGSWIILFANVASVFLLWVYSTTFKRRLLSGNIIISTLTAWVIFVIFFYTNAALRNSANLGFDNTRFLKFTILYAGFAFIVSLVREVIKDMEDVKGDAAHHCRTMPIVWGIPSSKVFTAVWIVVAIAGLLILQLFALQANWWMITGYSTVLVITPLLIVLRKLYKANEASDYHELSSWMKWIMLAGILSMLFFIQ